MGIKVVVNVDLQVGHCVGVPVQLVGDVLGQALILAARAPHAVNRSTDVECWSLRSTVELLF
jgi:hypothetical protein